MTVTQFCSFTNSISLLKNLDQKYLHKHLNFLQLVNDSIQKTKIRDDFCTKHKLLKDIVQGLPFDESFAPSKQYFPFPNH